MGNNAKCHECPEPGTICDSAGNVLVTLELERGYYRHTFESGEVYECGLGEEACIGGNGSALNGGAGPSYW